MLSLPFAMLGILLSWIVLGALLVGLGMLVLGRPERRTREGERAFTAFWLGYLVAIAFLQAWHLVAPVRAPALLALTSLSLLGWRRGAGLLATTRAAVREHPRLLVVATLFALWLANRALGPPVGDAGLYHLSAIRWFTSFPIVPGIANLHYRLGFNNPSLLWAALLEVGPWYGRSSHLANGVLVLGIGLRGLWGMSRVLRAPAAARPVDLFAALLLPVVVSHAVSLFELRLSSPDPDTAAALTALASATHLVSLLTDEHDGRHEVWTYAFAASSLAALAACIKVSMGPYAVGVALVALVSTARRFGARPIVAPLVACVALVVPWLFRGFVSSGYPLYPMTLVSFDVDWMLPRADAEATARWILEHYMPPVAQQMHRDGEGWLRPWIVWQATRTPELALLPLALCGVGLAMVGRAGASDPMRMRERARTRRVLWLLVPSSVALVVWIATAPHPRFGYAFLWAAAAASLTAAAHDALSRPESRRRALAVWALLGATAFPLVHRIAAWSWLRDGGHAVESVVLGPGPDHGLHPTPTGPLRSHTTRSGLLVYLPATGEQVWDAPLPATPELDSGLALRHPGELRAGFRSER